jgi:1-phosphofructokinase
MNRITSSRLDYVGKAVNVARNIAALGHASMCAGIIALSGSEETFRSIESSGAKRDFAVLEGSVRVNMKVMDLSKSVITEINESWTVPSDTYNLIEEIVIRNARVSDWVVLTGSLPKGLGADTYARLMKSIRVAAPTCKIALDAEGEAFSLALAQKPNLVKPNGYELSLITDKPAEGTLARSPGSRDLCPRAGVSTPQDAVRQGRTLLNMGAERVIVSMGSKGAVFISENTSLFSPALPVKVLSATGAGDAMLSGWVYGIINGMSKADAFRLACAAASAKVATEGTEAITREGCMRLLPQITILQDFTEE